jgi:hypothetical protein
MTNCTGCGRKRSSSNFKLLSWHLPGVTEETLSQYTRSPGRDWIICKKEVMGRTCSKHGADENSYRILCRNLSSRDCFRHLCVDINLIDWLIDPSCRWGETFQTCGHHRVYCSSPGWYVSVESHCYDDTGCGKPLTRPPEFSVNPTRRDIWERVGGMDEWVRILHISIWDTWKDP